MLLHSLRLCQMKHRSLPQSCAHPILITIRC